MFFKNNGLFLKVSMLNACHLLSVLLVKDSHHGWHLENIGQFIQVC